MFENEVDMGTYTHVVIYLAAPFPGWIGGGVYLGGAQLLWWGGNYRITTGGENLMLFSAGAEASSGSWVAGAPLTGLNISVTGATTANISKIALENRNHP